MRRASPLGLRSAAVSDPLMEADPPTRGSRSQARSAKANSLGTEAKRPRIARFEC